jgi:uncharacterized repeat protein (TIGR02543 family)
VELGEDRKIGIMEKPMSDQNSIYNNDKKTTCESNKKTYRKIKRCLAILVIVIIFGTVTIGNKINGVEDTADKNWKKAALDVPEAEAFSYEGSDNFVVTGSLEPTSISAPATHTDHVTESIQMPEPTVMPEPSPAPEPTVMPEPSPAPEPTVMPEPSPEPEPTVMPEPSPEPEPTVMPEPSPEPEPAVMPEPSPEPEPSPAPEPTVMPEPSPAPEPAVMPEPSPEPEPAPIPVPVKKEIEFKIIPYTGIYDGELHQLASNLELPSGASIEYSTDDKNYFCECPMGKDAGAYKIYYKINGGEDYQSYAGCGEAVIEQAEADLSVDVLPTEVNWPEYESFSGKYNYNGDGLIELISSDEETISIISTEADKTDDTENDLNIQGNQALKTGVFAYRYNKDGICMITFRSFSSQNYKEIERCFYVNINRNNYNLEIDLNGDESKDLNEENSQTEKISLPYEKVMDIPDPVRKGYTFTGWTVDNDKSVIENRKYIQGKGDSKIKANWEANKYTAKLVYGNGSPDKLLEIEYDNVLDLSEIPSKKYDSDNHYTFAGWYTEISGGLKLSESINYRNADNITIYAHWNNNPHTYTSTIIRNNSCTANGILRHTCSCGYFYDTVITAHGHTYSAWMTEKPATCMENGIEYRICTICGEKLETRIIGKSGHIWYEKQGYLEATCTMNGHYATSECSRCHIQIGGGVILAKGHNPGNWETEIASTKWDGGTEIRKCSVCGETVDRRTTTRIPDSWAKFSRYIEGRGYDYVYCTRGDAEYNALMNGSSGWTFAGYNGTNGEKKGRYVNAYQESGGNYINYHTYGYGTSFEMEILYW